MNFKKNFQLPEEYKDLKKIDYDEILNYEGKKDLENLKEKDEIIRKRFKTTTTNPVLNQKI